MIGFNFLKLMTYGSEFQLGQQEAPYVAPVTHHVREKKIEK